MMVVIMAYPSSRKVADGILSVLLVLS
jgi:hypothetical protein